MAANTDIGVRRRGFARLRRIVGKILTITAVTLAALFAVVILALVVGRLYFNDARLRVLAESKGSETLGAKLTIGGLEFSLLSGLEVHDLRLGPPDGFNRDPLTFRRLALHWSAPNLLRLHVVIPEIAWEGVTLVIEENEHGQNIQALLNAVRGPPTPSVERPPEEKAEKQPLTVEQPSIPVHVELRRLSLVIDRVEVIKPAQSLSLDKVGVQGHLEAEGQSMNLDLWLGLGDREASGEASHFEMRGGQPFPVIESKQRFGITVQSSGFGDVQLDVLLAAETALNNGHALPILKTTLDIQTHLDLLAQKLALESLHVTTGDGTELKARAEGESILLAPVARIFELDFRSDLAELAPLITAVAPGIETSGRVHVFAEPFTLVSDPKQLDMMRATLHLDLEEIGVRLKSMKLENLNLNTTATLFDGQAKLNLSAALATYQASEQEGRGINALLDVTTPLAPWMGGPTTGVVEFQGRFGVHGFALPGTSVAAVNLTLAGTAPVGLIKKEPEALPIVSRINLDIGKTASAGAVVERLRLQLDLSLWDLTGHTLAAKLAATTANVIAPYGKDTLALGTTALDVSLARRGDSYSIEKLSLTTGDALRMDLSGAVREAMSPMPIFDKLVLTLGPIDLPRALALLPEAQRPKATIAGNLGVTLKVDGRVPYRELVPKAKLPARDPSLGQAGLTKLMGDYDQFLQSWQGELERGLPFTASLATTLQDIHYADDTNDVRDVDMRFELAVNNHDLGLSYRLDVVEVAKPAIARELGFVLDLRFGRGLVEATSHFKAGALEQALLIRPVEDAGMELKLSYRVGGDLLLDRFRVEAPDRGLLFDMSGVMSKPLQFALSRGWERSGLPGLDATLRWALALNAGEQQPMTVKGPELGGRIGVSGGLRAADGVVGIDGMLETEHLGYLSGPTAVTEMSGVLPFDVRLTFDPRPDATILKRGVAVGGGVVALLTSGDDIRRRPARPTYYDRIRPYRQRQGLSARMIQSGKYEIADFALEGRVTQGMLLADAVSMHILGGDVTGNMALQLGRDATVRGDIAFKVSNIDASYFKMLNLEPGPSSELSLDLQLGLLLAPKNRDLTLNMNVTKIGSETLDRFLQLLDPTGKDEKMQANRKYLSLVRIDNVAVWTRYESLNIDLAVTTFLRIPGTSIGFPNIDRELLRRYSLRDRFDEIFNPLNDKYLAPLLGWSRAD